VHDAPSWRELADGAVVHVAAEGITESTV
jgi:hypothetical protein